MNSIAHTTKIHRRAADKRFYYPDLLRMSTEHAYFYILDYFALARVGGEK